MPTFIYRRTHSHIQLEHDVHVLAIVMAQLGIGMRIMHNNCMCIQNNTYDNAA